MNWVLPFRSIERVLIVLAGILCIYLGYLLFVKGVSGKTSLRAEFDKSKIQPANAMPGVFVALFGASILMFTIRQVIKFDAAIPVSSEGKLTVPQTSQQTTIPKLEFAEEDLKALKSLLPENVKIQSVEPCNSELNKQKYAIIHFATHGMLEPNTAAGSIAQVEIGLRTLIGPTKRIKPELFLSTIVDPVLSNRRP